MDLERGAGRDCRRFDAQNAAMCCQEDDDCDQGVPEVKRHRTCTCREVLWPLGDEIRDCFEGKKRGEARGGKSCGQR
jgi:hypothetical protein